MEDTATFDIEAIIRNSASVRARMMLLSTEVRQCLAAFDEQAQPNDTFFAPLREMPDIAAKVVALLSESRLDRKHIAELQEEVSQLNVRLQELEAQVADAKANLADLRQRPWYKSAVATIGSTALVAAVGGFWALSGSDIRIEERFNNLVLDWEYIFPPSEQPQETRQSKLPPSFEV